MPSFFMSVSAIFLNDSACGPSGSATTVGLPASASVQICGCSGISPIRSTPISLHFRLAPKVTSVSAVVHQLSDGFIPSRPNTSCLWPQLVHTKVLIFCTIPKMGTLTFRKRSTPLTASRKAKFCGVETITAPFTSQDHCTHLVIRFNLPDSSILCVIVN